MHKIISILRLKCPTCRKGAFLEKQPRPFWSWVRVKDQCPYCHTKFKIEPSFYYGSMYIAYALGVGVMGILSGIYFLVVSEINLLRLFFLIVGTLLVLNPYLNAWAKIIWANFFLSYDPKLTQSKKS